MKIITMFVLFAMIEIAQGQLAAAARNLYQPIILSFGTVFAFFDKKFDYDKIDVDEWI